MPGPGDYEQKTAFKAREGSNWAKASDKSVFDKSDSHSTVGPGSYDSSLILPNFYKNNYKSSFMSHSIRTMDARKGEISNKHRMKDIQRLQQQFNDWENDTEDYFEFINV